MTAKIADVTAIEAPKIIFFEGPRYDDTSAAINGEDHNRKTNNSEYVPTCKKANHVTYAKTRIPAPANHALNTAPVMAAVPHTVALIGVRVPLAVVPGL